MDLRLISIIRKEFIQILRDPRTLIMTLVIPIMQLFLLGYAATTDIKNIPLAVWDQNRTPQSRALLDAFRAADYFSIAYDVDSQDDVRALIENGKVRGALIIPPDYDRRLLGVGQRDHVRVFIVAVHLGLAARIEVLEAGRHDD